MSKAIQKKEVNEVDFFNGMMKRALQSKIVTPDDYSLENAIKSAWLEIEREKYLDRCTKASVANAVMDMIVQGLNLTKEQGYFIAYGNILKFSRSWYGSIAVAKRFVPEVARINYAVIYGGDEFKIEIIKGVRFPRGHHQDFANVRLDNIIGAYAIALDHQGNEYAADIMTFDDIKQSWRRSPKKGEKQPILSNGEVNPKSDHGQQPDRFACRTVVNRLCKAIISVTDDKELLRAIRHSDEDNFDDTILEVDYEPEESKVIDFKPPEPEPVKMIEDSQLKKIENLLKSDKNVIGAISEIIGVEIKSLESLTFDDAQFCIKTLEERKEDIPDAFK